MPGGLAAYSNEQMAHTQTDKYLVVTLYDKKETHDKADRESKALSTVKAESPVKRISSTV